MKAFHGLGVSNVVILLTIVISCITAIPTGDSIPATLHGTLEARAGPTVADIRNIATTTFAIQLVGAQTTHAGIKSLCEDFDVSRLVTLGYNATILNQVFCEANSRFAPDLPRPEQVTAYTIQYSSWIWIYQAVGALKDDQNRLRLLCHLIDVPASFSVGQNGTLVKDQICNVGNGAELPTPPDVYFTLPGNPDNLPNVLGG
ncbi:MAG: hypothetical protein LQ346_008371 [Caloplaca aetnensis]|nr:MAG: hypothetical protein LQ346_008371 [Caloplaca aetnensis]